MKIKELPITEQPREKLLAVGVENLTDAELLSIILRTGTKDANVKDVAINILSSIDSINELSDIGIRELSKIKGVGIIKASTILASIELGKRVVSKETSLNMKLNNNYLVHEAFKKYFIGLKQEQFLVIFLDTKKRLIKYKVMFVGTLDKAIVHPREIFNEALKLGSSSIIVMHNHPSLDITPSKEDLFITNKIKQSGEILGIPLIDHIITNGKDYYSFYDEYYQK